MWSRETGWRGCRRLPATTCREESTFGRERGRGLIGRAVCTGRTTLGLALVVLLVGGALAGCGPGTAADGEGTGGTLVVRGSDTLVNLSAAWAEAFMEANPGVQVSVSGGGSSTGFAGLIEGSVDLATASREVNDFERQALIDRGTPPVEHVVAVDAVTMIVHPSNPVRELTMSQLADILTGQVTNWADVGGPDLAITIYSRETSSGTYAFVRERVMGNKDYAASARLLPSTYAIIEAVAQDRGGIGYVGMGYVTDAVVALKVAGDEASEPVEATVENVTSGAYPLARNLFIYSAGEPGPLAKAFIEFCTSETGRAITEEMGFVPPAGGR
ncbi:MAG TPA: hypothetical protein DHW14_01430 [Clostridiales bacterium]|nr:hypothetical protein [Clostridiales bacterium]